MRINPCENTVQDGGRHRRVLSKRNKKKGGMRGK
jgi:hypothetical protein